MAISFKSGNFDPCPEGEFNAVCVDVHDLGIVESTYKGVTKKQHKILLTWQVDQKDTEGLPFLVFKRYTASLNEKAALLKDLSRWFRGADFSKMVANVKKDADCLIGKGCRLEIVHSENGANTYANVDSIRPLAAGQDAPAAHPKFVRKKDRSEGVGPFGMRNQASDPDDHDEDPDF